jgi:hypothetical protein
MTGRDSDQQQPGRWGSSKFIIVLSILVAVALAGSFVSKMGTNPADAPSPPAATSKQDAAESEVQTPAGSSKNQPADSPKP